MLDNELDAGQSPDDDSPFLSMADFFSLISLTLIYIVIVFAPQSPAVESSVDAIRAVAQGTGPASPIDTEIAYMAIFSEQDNFLLRYMHASATAQEELFPISAGGQTKGKDWLLAQLQTGEPPKRIVFYIRSNEPNAEVHKVFNQLTQAMTDRFAVSTVFLSQDDPTF